MTNFIRNCKWGTVMPKGSSCPELSCTVLPMQYSIVFLAQRTLLDHHPLPLIAVAGIRRSYAVILEDLHRSSRSSTLSRTCPDCTDLVISHSVQCQTW